MSQKQLVFLDKLHDAALELFRGVKFEKRFEADGYIVCLYASMIELSGGILALVQSDRLSALPPVFRTFLEAYVDLKNIIQYPSYIKNCYARHHENWIKVFKNSRDPNPYLAGICGHEASGVALKRHETELQRLKDEGFPPLKIVTRFEMADMAVIDQSTFLKATALTTACRRLSAAMLS
jgi:hypothetical protein